MDDVAEMSIEELVEEWLSSYQNEHTRRAYERDILDFLGWCKRQGLEPLEIRRVHGNRFHTHLIDQGHSNETVARKLAGARSFFEYWLQEDKIGKNPLRFVKHKFDRGISSTTRGLTAEEANVLMATAEAQGDRDYILCGLMLFCGLRIGEVVGARVENLGEKNGHRVLWIIGKGSKAGEVRLSPLLAAAIDRYLDGRTEGPLICPLRASGHKHVKCPGCEEQVYPPVRPLTRQGAWRRYKRLVELAGLSVELSPHSSRHAAVTLALEGGVPLHVVQDFARHSNPMTTQRYNRNRFNLENSPTPMLEELVLGAGGEG